MDLAERHPLTTPDPLSIEAAKARYATERAKRLLADPDQGQPILDVAFECGFGSVGPFNRAFRAQVGVTPREFRATSRRLS